MRYLITGGCGFVGTNLASEILRRGEELFIMDNLFRVGSANNLKVLRNEGSFEYFHADIRSYNDVESVIKNSKPDVIFHLAGQVAMTTSLENPRQDFEINVIGGHNLLECVRKFAPSTIVLYSSTNKVYGDLNHLEFLETETRYICNQYPDGFNENLPLCFESPYGCLKGAVDQYMLDYARMFDLNTVVFRHSSIYGSNQNSTIDQGWVGWFVKNALEISNKSQTEPFSISGNGKQVRDVLHADDLIECYFKAIKNIETTRGNAYNIGGGFQNSLSLIELFNVLEEILSIKMHYHELDWRQSDQKIFIANIKKAKSHFGWEPTVSYREGIIKTKNWMMKLEKSV